MLKANSQKRNKKEIINENIQKKSIQKVLRYPIKTKSSKLCKAQEDQREKNRLKNIQSEIIIQPPLIGDQTPRFVSCISHDVYNGNLKEYTWNQDKIFVHECLQDDLLMLQNVFEGKIISPLIYPLVFDHKSPEKEVSLRSIQFYKEVQNNSSLYTNLSPDDKGYFLIGVRDLFIAACRDMLSQDEKEMLMNIVDLIDPRDNNIVYKTINNTDIAPYPTATHKLVRFIEEEKSEEDNNVLDECFVRNELGLLIGFIDPRDLSFHNFENIINLDSLFKIREDFPISNFRQHGNNQVYTFDLTDESGSLLALDKCGLYTQPINKLSRGGERFIFASRVLGNSLTNALNTYVPDKTLINYQFKFVNYVFRYNKFKPGDKKFTSHFDTPYHDPTRKQYSKYTLLLYLTPGSADPVLSIDNGRVRIDSIENAGYVRGVIFDQKYEHEGKSFIDSDKIFLRTELIYEYRREREPKMNEEISRKFNIACYMTKQSVFNSELERYASDCFNQVAQARIDLSKADLTKDVLIYKKYKRYSFITNGYDYWFLKSISLKDAGIIAILDYFNCKYERNESFNKLTFDSVVELSEINDINQVFDYLKRCTQCKHSVDVKETSDEEDLAESLQCDIEEQDFEEELSENQESSQKSKEQKTDNMVEETIINDLFEVQEKSNNIDIIQEEKEKDEKNDEKKSKSESEEEEEEKEEEEDDDSDEINTIDKSDYCSYCEECHDATRTPEPEELAEFIEDNNAGTEIRLKEMKKEFTIFLFNKEIKIEKSKITVTDDAIVFANQMPEVNFAAALGACGPTLDFDNHHTIQNIHVKGYSNIPPIPYKKFNEGYHLKIELFNNGFVRDLYEKLEKFSKID